MGRIISALLIHFLRARSERFERLAALGRRHDEGGIIALNAFHQPAIVAIAGNDGKAVRTQFAEGAVFGVEPQFRLACLLIGAVTGEAVIREDRTNLAREVDASPWSCSAAQISVRPHGPQLARPP